MKDARRWFFKGCRITDPTKKVETRTAGKGERKTIVSTCALGAMQIGYVAEYLNNKADPRKFHTFKNIRDNAEGMWAKIQELCDRYEEYYGTPLWLDNDTFGRDFVYTRIEKLR